MDKFSRAVMARKFQLGRPFCLWAQLENYSALSVRNPLRRFPEVLRNVELDYFGHGTLLRPSS